MNFSLSFFLQPWVELLFGCDLSAIVVLRRLAFFQTNEIMTIFIFYVSNPHASVSTNAFHYKSLANKWFSCWELFEINISIQKVKQRYFLIAKQYNHLYARYTRYLPTHKLLLNSTLCSLTAFSCASRSVSIMCTAPFLAKNRNCRTASSIVMPRMRDAMYHIFSGLYLIFVFWWQTNWKFN